VSAKRSQARKFSAGKVQSTELMVALQMGRATGSVCDTESLGAVTTSVPSRGHAFPVVVSAA
jgi:hypothetical protein